MPGAVEARRTVGRTPAGARNDDEIEPLYNDITALDPSPSPSGQPGGIVGPRVNATSSSDNRVAAAAVSKATNTSNGTSVYDGRLRQRRRVERNGRRGSHVGEYCVGGRKSEWTGIGKRRALEIMAEAPQRREEATKRAVSTLIRTAGEVGL